MHSNPFLISCFSLLFAATACKKDPPPGPSEGGVPKPEPSALPLDARPSPSVDAPAVPSSPDASGTTSKVDETDPGPEVPSAFVRFEDLLQPLVSEPRSEARSRKTCKMIEKLRIASLAVRRSMPKGVDEAAWEEASDEMRGAFEGMGATCTNDPPSDNPDLAIIHKSYARLRELMPE